MRFLFRATACLLVVLAVSAFAALMWDRSDAAAQNANGVASRDGAR